MQTALITSRDPKGLQFMSVVEAAYNKAKLDGDAAQLLNERGDELKAGVSELIAKLSVTNQYADEETESSYGYFSGYDKPKSLQEQVAVLKKLFPELGDCDFALGDKELPDGAEGHFAFPRWQKLGKSCGEALQRVLNELSKAYGGHFKNWREGQLGPTNLLRQSSKSAAMWEKIGTEQSGDILVVAAQFGIRHRGRGVRRAREVMRQAEFGLGAFAVGIMLLTHENRLRHYDDLWIDCAGDEFHDPQDSDAPFVHAPYFAFGGGSRLEFDTRWSGNASGYYGSASGFLVPQS